MRILLAGANRTIEGGAETYQRALLAALAAEGHAGALLHERPAGAGRPTVDGEPPGTPVWGITESGSSAALERAARWAPDVVYVHGLESPSLEAQLLDRWPGVLFAHNYYGTCATGTKRHAFPQVAMCTRRFGPACLALHYPRRCGGLSPASMLRMYRSQAARRALLPRYRAICVASEHMRAEYLRHGVPDDRVPVLHLPPPGVTRDPAPPAARSVPDHLVMAGRLTQLKGAALLLDALPRASRELGRSLSLTILGDGPQRGSLEARARALGIAAKFTGWVSEAERNRLLHTADLHAMPSLWPEPWGLVGLEAACAGVPSVAFAVGGIPEWLVAGASGELAPADPPTAGGLAQAIVRAARDPAHHARLRRGAWEQAARFTMESHLRELLPVLAAAATG
jgi:glycosyltransferase involved in cell wall biosynthesis